MALYALSIYTYILQQLYQFVSRRIFTNTANKSRWRSQLYQRTRHISWCAAWVWCPRFDIFKRSPQLLG
jgi:hypothetical protein